MILLLQNEHIAQDPVHLKPILKTVDDLYKQLFYEYFEKLYSYAFTIVKHNDEAKDIVQSAFIKLWEKRYEIHLHTSAKSYLYKSVYNLSLNIVRNRRIRESHHKEIASQQTSNKYNTAEEKEIRDKIHNAVNQLPQRCKEVFYKSRFEGKKYAEIAEEMNISVKTVEVQMGKALKSLREKLSDLIIVWIICNFF